MTEDHLQRRLATILAADVFGYSRLTAENEEDTLRTLKAHRSVIDRLIERHEGRIFNTAGDSVLAEFGSAVEAVRCAITIQEELRVRNAQIDEKRRMNFRIGINVGDVLVDGDNLYGDGVNIAARLESIAVPGNICISGSVYSLVKNKLSYGFEDIGLQAVKNIPEPVPAFRLTPTPITPPPKPRPALPRRRLIAAGAVLVVICVAALGAWTMRSTLSGGNTATSSARVQASAPIARPVAPLATPPSTNQQAKADVSLGFDGVWEFTVAGGQFCPLKSFTFLRKIQGGLVLTPRGQAIGTISNDGSFHFSNPSPSNANIVVESQGQIAGEAGTGSYAGVGTPCQGTYQIRLVEKR